LHQPPSPLFFRPRMSKANTYINMQPAVASAAQQLSLKRPHSPSWYEWEAHPSQYGVGFPFTLK